MSLVPTNASSSKKSAASREIHALQKAIKSFRSSLSDEEQSELQHAQQDGIAADTNAAITFTAKLDQSRSTKGPSIASRLHNVLQSVWEFSTIVDTFVSSHPEIAALVWGSMKLTMKLVMNYTSYAESLSQLFMRLTHYCPRFTEYQALFPNSRQLQDALCRFYTALIKSCEHMVEVYRRSGAQLMLNVFRSFEEEFKPDEGEIKQRGRDVKIAVEYAKMESDELEKQRQQEERQEQSISRRFMRTSLINTESDLQSIKDHQSAQAIAISNIKKRSLIDSLTSHDHSIPYKEAVKRRHKGTAEWIFRTPEFKRWTGSTHASSSVLFCSGKIGCGKTILTASAVSHHLIHRKTSDDCILFFFICHDNLESRKADTIVRSIVKQSLRHATLSERLFRELSDISSSTHSSLEDIGRLLRIGQQSWSSDNSITIFLDGLNELEPSERLCLLKLLELLRGQIPRIKLFLSGQESLSKEVFRVFGPLVSISMAHDMASSDISLYVEETLKERQIDGTLKLNDEHLIEEISHRLTSHAGGMFLWVTYLISDICSHQRDKDIRAALRSLPKDLEDTFDRILQRIALREKDKLVQSILQWVAMARRNLTLGELREAISIDVNQEFLHDEDLVNGIENVASWCENLVQVDEELKTVRYAHFSIYDFIISKRSTVAQFRFNVKEADHHAGEICLTFLHLSNFTTTLARLPHPTEVRLPDPGDIARTTAKQAKISWINRLVSSSISKREQKRAPYATWRHLAGFSKANGMATFELQEAHPFLDYVRWYWASHTRGFVEDRSATWNLLRNVASNSHGLAIMPWEAATGPNRKRHLWAYKKNHFAILSLCVADGDLLPWEYCKLLSGACREGDVRLVTCLISPKHKYDDDDNKELALMEACRGGHLQVVRLLIHAGACATGGHLAFASKVNNLQLMEILLAAGADPNTDGWDDGSPLRAAARRGHIDALKRLLAAGAVDTGLHASAFVKAAEEGHLNIIVRLLKEPGVLDVRWGSDGTHRLDHGFMMACGRGHVQCVRGLLAAGADANLRIGSFKLSPLILAAENGHSRVAHVLLDAGANPRASDQTNRTALHFAAGGGHDDIVRKLLAAGSDVEVAARRTADKFGTYGGETPLHLASKNGHLEIVRLLISSKANINTVDERGYTALHFAAEGGHQHVTPILIFAGANIDNATKSVELFPGGIVAGSPRYPLWADGKTASQLARSNGHVVLADELEKKVLGVE